MEQDTGPKSSYAIPLIRSPFTLIADLVEAEKNKKGESALRQISNEFAQTVLSESFSERLQEKAFDVSLEKAFEGLPNSLKALVAEMLFRSNKCPFSDEKMAYIAQKVICPIEAKKSVSVAPVCFKNSDGAPFFRVQEDVAVYGLYEGATKRQTLSFAQEPQIIAWDGSGLECAYLCKDGAYFQAKNGQGFIKRSFYESVDQIDILAFHPQGRVALLGLGTAVKFIFSDDHESISREHTHPITAARFSSEGALCATGDEKGVVCLWSSENGTIQQRLLSKDSTAVTALGFDAPEGTKPSKLIVGYASGFARVWDIAKSMIVVAPGHHTSSVIKADLIEPVGITLGNEGIITLWSSTTGAIFRSIDCDPLRTSWIVAKSIEYGQRDVGQELAIISVKKSFDGEQVVCDRYDFDVMRYLVAHANVLHDPLAVIRMIAFARVAKKYGEKVSKETSL